MTSYLHGTYIPAYWKVGHEVSVNPRALDCEGDKTHALAGQVQLLALKLREHIKELLKEADELSS